MANRRAKLFTYIVKMQREVEYTAELEIQARSAEEAEGMAEAIVDEQKPSSWREGHIVSASTKARVKRG